MAILGTSDSSVLCGGLRSRLSSSKQCRVKVGVGNKGNRIVATRQLPGKGVVCCSTRDKSFVGLRRCGSHNIRCVRFLGISGLLPTCKFIGVGHTFVMGDWRPGVLHLCRSPRKLSLQY